MLQPSHRPRSFVANRQFVGREAELSLLRNAIEKPQLPDKHRVLAFSGPGGQGKTTLLKHFRDYLNKHDAQLPTTCAVLDFQDPAYRGARDALLSIR